MIFKCTLDGGSIVKYEEEAWLLLALFPVQCDFRFEFLHSYYEVVLLCKFLDLVHEIERYNTVDNEHSVEESDEEGKCQVVGKPVHSI